MYRILYFLVTGLCLAGAFWINSSCFIALWKQFTSQNYSTAIGQITRSELTQHPGKNGEPIYRANIEYNYTVNGKSFEGYKLRYIPNPFQINPQWCKKTLNEHPTGSQVEVFYNPNIPEDAVLEKNLKVEDFTFAPFVIMVNLLLFYLWRLFADAFRLRIYKPIAGGVKIITDGMRTRIRLPQFNSYVLLFCILVTSAAIHFFLLSLKFYFNPRTLIMVWLAIWGALVIDFAAFLWHRQKIHSGRFDVVLDDGSRSIELPKTYGRKEPVSLKFSQIEKITLEPIKRKRPSKEKGDKKSFFQKKLFKGSPKARFHGTMLWLKGQSEGMRLFLWSDKMKGELFTDWLRQRLGLLQGI